MAGQLLLHPGEGGGYLGAIRPPEALIAPPPGYNKSCPAIGHLIGPPQSYKAQALLRPFRALQRPRSPQDL